MERMISHILIEDWLKTAYATTKQLNKGCMFYNLKGNYKLCVGYVDCDITAGIKFVDNYEDDYEYLHTPQYSNGYYWSTDIVLNSNTDYEEITNYYLEELNKMLELEIDSDGIFEKGEINCYEDLVRNYGFASDSEWINFLNSFDKECMFSYDNTAVCIEYDFTDEYIYKGITIPFPFTRRDIDDVLKEIFK